MNRHQRRAVSAAASHVTENDFDWLQRIAKRRDVLLQVRSLPDQDMFAIYVGHPAGMRYWRIQIGVASDFMLAAISGHDDSLNLIDEQIAHAADELSIVTHLHAVQQVYFERGAA